MWRAGAALAIAAGGALVGLLTWVVPLAGVRSWVTSLPIAAHSVSFPHVWVVGGILAVLASATAALIAEFGGRKERLRVANRAARVDNAQNAGAAPLGEGAAQESRARGRRRQGKSKEARRETLESRRTRARMAVLAALFWAIAAVSPLAGLAPMEARPFASGHVTEGWRTLNVLEWNVGSSVGPGEIADLLHERVVDVAVLPEQVSGRLDLASYTTFESAHTGGIAPVTVAIRSGLGTYRIVDHPGEAATFGSLLLEPAPGTGGERWLPRILAVHAAPPVPGLMTQWAQDQEHILALAGRFAPTESDPRPLLVVGDFNAARWHGAQARMEAFADVLEWVEPMRRGTWPARVPGLTSLEGIWRTPIDHILVPATARDHTAASVGEQSDPVVQPGAVRVGHVEVMRRQSSDHLAVYAMLQIRELDR